METADSCSIEGCTRKVLHRGWCQPHYRRWLAWGDPQASAPVRTEGSRRPGPPVPERFRRRFRVSRRTGCYVWTGATANGYPLFAFTNEAGEYVRVSARRWMWEHERGPVDPRDQIVSTCGERMCVNPHHLRVASRQELAYARSEA